MLTVSYTNYLKLAEFILASYVASDSNGTHDLACTKIRGHSHKIDKFSPKPCIASIGLADMARLL